MLNTPFELSSESICDSGSSSDESLSSAFCRRDVVVDVPIPISSSEAALRTAQQAHVVAAREAFPRLIASPAGPSRLVKCAKQACLLRGRGLVAFRAQQMAMLREQSRKVAKRSQELLETAVPHARDVLQAAGKNGPNLGLLEWCLNKIEWHDTDLITHLQNGFPLVGHIPADAEAPSSQVRSSSLSIHQLTQHGRDAWAQQLRRHSGTSSDLDADIYRQTMDEVRLGRMTVPVEAASQEAGVVTRRFGVSQLDSKGVSKVRCIDDFKESRVNDACSVSRRIRMGRISDLEFVARLLSTTGEPLVLLKSDFKAAYRSLPIQEAHLDLARVLFRDCEGAVLESTQLAMPFGGVASVFAWDRLGAALAAILQELLLILCPRYVDDLFWADFLIAADGGRLAALELVTLLGFTLEERKTPMPAPCQDILGVRVSLLPDGSGLQFTAEPRKAALWSLEISETLRSPDVDLLRFRKLAGRLSFAAWAIWGQIATCHLAGVHQQVREWSSSHRGFTLVVKSHGCCVGSGYSVWFVADGVSPDLHGCLWAWWVRSGVCDIIFITMGLWPSSA